MVSLCVLLASVFLAAHAQDPNATNSSTGNASAVLVTSTAPLTGPQSDAALCASSCPGLQAFVNSLEAASEAADGVRGEPWCRSIHGSNATVRCVLGTEACARAATAVRSNRVECLQYNIDITLASAQVQASTYNVSTCSLCASSGGASGDRQFFDVSVITCEQLCANATVCDVFDYDATRALCRTWEVCPRSARSGRFGCAWSVYERPGAIYDNIGAIFLPASDSSAEDSSADGSWLQGPCPASDGGVCGVCDLGREAMGLLASSSPCRECRGLGDDECQLELLGTCTLSCREDGMEASPPSLVCSNGQWVSFEVVSQSIGASLDTSEAEPAADLFSCASSPFMMGSSTIGEVSGVELSAHPAFAAILTMAAFSVTCGHM